MFHNDELSLKLGELIIAACYLLVKKLLKILFWLFTAIHLASFAVIAV